MHILKLKKCLGKTLGVFIISLYRHLVNFWFNLLIDINFRDEIVFFCYIKKVLKIEQNCCF